MSMFWMGLLMLVAGVAIPNGDTSLVEGLGWALCGGGGVAMAAGARDAR